MRAMQLQRPTELVAADLPIPEIGPSEVLLEVEAVGVCQTDLHIRRAIEQLVPEGVVLGHEVAGRIARLGDGVTDWHIGDAAIVHPCWSCGTCSACIRGHQNACRKTGDRLAPPPTPGVSVNGGMAECVAVPARALVGAEDLDPAVACVLPDAALVPYHSIHALREQLHPGASAVVIGIGGLGHLAVQMLREITGVRVIALDVRDDVLASVTDSVDHVLRADDATAATQVVDMTGGEGAEAVFDFVGNDDTLKLSAATVAPYGAIRVPGLAEGSFTFETGQLPASLPWGASLTRPYSGTYNDLEEVVALARAGRINPSITRYPFTEALTALDDLAAGKYEGRAVLMMDT